MNATRYRWLLFLVAAVALVAFLVGFFFSPADPLREKLELVQVGMTQDAVEDMLGAPTMFAEWNDDVDVLTYKGHDGVAVVRIDRQSRQVVRTAWVEGREPEWRAIWRWARGER